MTKIPFKFLICLALFAKAFASQDNNNSQTANAGVDKRNFVDLFVDSVCTFCNILITCCHEQRPELQLGISLFPNVLQNHHQLKPGHRKPHKNRLHPTAVKPYQQIQSTSDIVPTQYENQLNNNEQKNTLPATMTNNAPLHVQQTQQSEKSSQYDNTFQTPSPPYSQYNLPIQKPQQNNPSQPNYPPTNDPQNFNSLNLQQQNKIQQLHKLSSPNNLTPQNSQHDIPPQNPQNDISLQNPQNDISLQNSLNDISLQNPKHDSFLQNPHINYLQMQNAQSDNSHLQKPIDNNHPLLNPPYESENVPNLKHENPSQTQLQLNNSQLAKYPSQQMSNLSIENLLSNNNNQLIQNTQHNTLLPGSNNVDQLAQNSNHENLPIQTSQIKIPFFSNTQNNATSLNDDKPSLHNPQTDFSSQQNYPQHALNPSLQNMNPLPYLDLTNNSQNSQFEISNNPISSVINVSAQQDQAKSHDSQFPLTPSPLHFTHPKLEPKLPVNPYFIADKPNKVLPPIRPVGI